MTSWWRHLVSNYKVFKVENWPFANCCIFVNLKAMIFKVWHLIDQDWGNIWKVNAKIVWPLLRKMTLGRSLPYIFFLKIIMFWAFLRHNLRLKVTWTLKLIGHLNLSIKTTQTWLCHDDVTWYWITLNQSLIFVKNHNSWTTCRIFTIYTSSDWSLKGQQTLHTTWPRLTFTSGSNRKLKISQNSYLKNYVIF